MTAINISLPGSLMQFAEQQAAAKGYGTASEYVCALIRREQDRQRLRNLLLAGAESGSAGPADAAYFDRKREAIRRNYEG
jgi:antitoxin ParD1/3/4